MKKIKLIKGFLAFLCFLLAAITMLYSLGRIFVPKWTQEDAMQTYMLRGLYAEEKNSIQVFTIGDSDVYRGVSPQVIYQKSGITSYSLSSSSQRMWQSYYSLKHALQYQKPEAVFLEVNAIRYSSGREIAMMHQYFDNMKLDSVKWEALQDPVFGFSLQEKLNFIFPIFEFHSRYKELKQEDVALAFGNLRNPEKGMAMSAAVYPYKGSMDYMNKKTGYFEMAENTREYLEKLTTLCEKENIRLVLFKAPEPNNWRLSYHNSVASFAKEHDLPFLDFNMQEYIKTFDFKKDTMDKGTHLNIHGAEKLSSQMADYMENVLKLEPIRDQTITAEYRKDNDQYMKDVKQAMKAWEKEKKNESSIK